MSDLIVVRREPLPDRMGESRLQLDRARSQFADLLTKIQSWGKLGAYDSVPERDFKTGERVLRFIVLSRPPIVWGQEMADIANTFRSALNIAIHAVATPDSDDIGFPIYRVESEYRNERPKARKPHDRLSPRDYYLTGVHDRYRAVVDACQPYRRGNDADAHPLAMLSDLTNTNKHRRLTVAMAMPSQASLELIPLQPYNRIKAVFYSPGLPLHDRTELVRFSTIPKDSEVAVKGRIAIEIAFGERGITAANVRGVETYIVKIISRLAAIQVESAA